MTIYRLELTLLWLLLRIIENIVLVTAASQLHKAISMVMAHTRTDVLVF
jgi:hypothetical protein